MCVCAHTCTAGHYLNNITPGASAHPSPQARSELIVELTTATKDTESHGGYQSLESLVLWSLLGGAGGGPLRRVA